MTVGGGAAADGADGRGQRVGWRDASQERIGENLGDVRRWGGLVRDWGNNESWSFSGIRKGVSWVVPWKYRGWEGRRFGVERRGA